VKPFGGLPVVAGDIVMGIVFTPRRQGDVVVRLNRQTLPLLNTAGAWNCYPSCGG